MANIFIIGVRRDYSDNTVPQAGEYGRNEIGEWYCAPPETYLLGNLSKHTVVEHEDGTITVSPSILITGHEEQWHGYLQSGIWHKA